MRGPDDDGRRTVGFIGLGIMGAPMAKNLLGAGYDLVVHNRSRQSVEQLAELGAQPAASAADVGAACGQVITMLTDDSAVESVYLTEGLLDSLGSGALVIDMSTISPAMSRRVASEAVRRQIDALDAPVSGGEQGAIDGTLSIMAGGTPDAFDRARPLFEVLGATVAHVGSSGAGQTVKAANQLLVGGIIELVSEAIVFLEAQRVELPPALEVLAGGLAGNRILDRKAANMAARSFQPGFRLALHHKDMGILMNAAREAGVPLPAGGAVAQMFTAARARGDGQLDHSALLRTVEALAGHE